MTSKHLGIGDPKPPFGPTKKFRLYSMRFCPFSQRGRLVAAAKGVKDFEIVNLKLREELPEWYSTINPARSVPLIEFPDGLIIGESLIVAELIDEMYPDNILQSKDPITKAKQKLFIEKCGKTFIPAYFKYLKQRTDEMKEELIKNLSIMEQCLIDCKTKYFAGDKVGMVDYMVWPWFERLPVMYTLSADLHPNLTNWCKLMYDDPAVKETSSSKELYMKFFDAYLGPGKTLFDF